MRERQYFSINEGKAAYEESHKAFCCKVNGYYEQYTYEDRWGRTRKGEKLENDLANARTRGGDNFNYKLFVKAFCESGKPFQKILLKKHETRSGAPWYVPKIWRVRKTIAELGLPVEVQQRTSRKDDSVVPTMILYRTDDEGE